MTTFGRQKGFSLLEVLIAMALLGVVALIALTFVTRSMGYVDRVSMEARLQGDLQKSIDIIIAKMREANSLDVALYRWTETRTELDGSTSSGTQDALSLFSARDKNGNFIFSTAAGGNITISAAPVWQAVVVYAYYKGDHKGIVGELWEYTDYSTSRVYDDNNPVRVSSLNATTITLTDGTVFNRNGKPGDANQVCRKIADNLYQLIVPNYTKTTGYKADSLPLALHVVLQRLMLVDKKNPLKNVTVTMDTDVLTRNNN